MAEKTAELTEILKTLDTLQDRVKELTTDDESVAPEAVRPPTPAPAPAPQPAAPVSALPSIGADALQGALSNDQISLLRKGFADLSTFSKHKSFPEYFSRLAEKTGLRMLLLKRWTSGLQVFVETNIKMPSEAKKKRKDGRAPIPCKKNDIFAATGDEAAVYSGPVPVQHFPLDLTLMLGRGSRDRQIIIVPLPSQNHWNTFLYLDADQSTEKDLVVAELLAHFALARMCMLNKGVRTSQGRVNQIRKAEVLRRRDARALRPKGAAGTKEALAELDIDPFAVSKAAPPPAAEQIPLAPESVPESAAERAEETSPEPALEAAPEASAPTEPEAATLEPRPDPTPEQSAKAPFAEDEVEEIERPLPAKNEGLTPELIISQSGELPALPKAACHIMAVIEDPRTTATRLEKALAMDQALTAKVLRIANSPFYGAVREIRTVSESIVRLGFVTIRNWTLVTAARSVFLAPGAGLMYKKIWTQSVLSAMAGQLVAQSVGRADAEAIFIGGLMQNIGQLVLARCQPVMFQEILTEAESSGRPYHEIERETLGFDHGELGAILIKEWNLSRELEEAVRWHHDFLNPEAKHSHYAAMIALGEEIAWESLAEKDESAPAHEPVDESGEPGYAGPQLSEAATYLGISVAQLDALKEEASKLKIDPHFFN